MNALKAILEKKKKKKLENSHVGTFIHNGEWCYLLSKLEQFLLKSTVNQNYLQMQ